MSQRPQPSEETLDALIEGAWTQLGYALDGSDSSSTLGLAILAANLAFVAVVFTKEDRWSWWWMIPLLAAAVCSFALWDQVRTRKVNLGPDARRFYRRHGAKPPVAAKMQLLADLAHAVEQTSEVLPAKARAFRIARWALAAELLSGSLILVALHARWIN